MQKGLIIGIVIALVILGGVIYLSTTSDSDTLSGTALQEAQNSVPQVPTTGKTVLITPEGFSPAELSVQSGENVFFINQMQSPSWPASAVHPTHEVYPGSSINKCGAPESLSIFDACRGLLPGESWSFTFTEQGAWNYHDHLNPNLRGTIIVQ